MRARGWQSGVETPFDFARHGGQAQDEPHSKKATRCWRHGGQAAGHALTKQKPQPSKSMKGCATKTQAHILALRATGTGRWEKSALQGQRRNRTHGPMEEIGRDKGR